MYGKHLLRGCWNEKDGQKGQIHIPHQTHQPDGTERFWKGQHHETACWLLWDKRTWTVIMKALLVCTTILPKREGDRKVLAKQKAGEKEGIPVPQRTKRIYCREEQWGTPAQKAKVTDAEIQLVKRRKYQC